MFNPSRIQACLAILAAAFLWSTSFVATKIALVTFEPMTLAALRMTLATFLLGLMLLGKKEFVRPTRPDFYRMCSGGLLGITFYFLLENWGLKFSSATDGALLVGAFPIIAMLLERVIYGIRLSWLRFSGALVAIVGICMIVGNDAIALDVKRVWGDVLLILTGVSWAFYNFATRPIVNKYPLMTTNFLQALSGTLAIYPFAFFETHQWKMIPSSSIICVIYLGMFCSVAAFLFYTWGLRTLDSSSAVGILNTIPVFGVICSVVVLGENLALLQIIGGLIVICGVYMSVSRARLAEISPPST